MATGYSHKNTKESAPLTQGSVLHQVVRFAIPFLAAYLLQTLYGLCDLFLVGRFALVADTTAVAIGSQVMHVLTVIIVGLAMGTTVLVGRAAGEGGNKGAKRAAKVIGNTSILFAITGISAAFLLLAFTPCIVSLLSTPSEAFAPAVRYLTICFAGVPAITAYNIISSVLRGMGDSKSPLIFVSIAAAANIALDCLFIEAFQWGAGGAALGTIVSQVISAAISLIYIRSRFTGKGASVPLHRSDFHLDSHIIKQLLGIGVPVMLQDGFIQLSFIVITVIANARGLEDAAAVGIVEKVIGIMFLVPSSMLSTVSVAAAQCIGAGDGERARKSLKVCIYISVGAGLLFAILPQFPIGTHSAASMIAGFFTKDSRVAASGGEYLRSYVWDCILAGVHFCFSGYFCAAGKAYLSFIHNCISAFLVRIPLAYILSAHFAETLLPMGFAPPAGSLVSVAICVVMYRRLINLTRQRTEKAGSASDLTC